ncbi:MAG TPA: lysophospholipid acyltransferase family protein [Verrucomicrobiae bacterium]|nr:lysophospholipid acyltransferase family protein [Verrucomicrobiae bacterium]
MATRRKPVKRYSRWKRLRHRLEAALLTPALWAIPFFPYQAVRRVGRSLGWLGYWLLGGQRRVALANLDVAFGDTKTHREKTRIARTSFQTFGAAMLGLFWSARFTPALTKRIVEVHDSSLQIIRDCVARGKGVIFIMMHYGDWELQAPAFGFREIPITVIAKKMRNPALERIFVQLRSRWGHRVVAGPYAMLHVLRTLRRGGCVAVLVDQHVGLRSGGTWCDFFGLPVLTNSTIGQLELRSGAAIVTSIAHPLPDGRIRIDCQELPYQPSGDAPADIQMISQRCLDFCEAVIRQNPDHWLWSYKRWRARPHPEFGRFPAYSRQQGV